MLACLDRNSEAQDTQASHGFALPVRAQSQQHQRGGAEGKDMGHSMPERMRSSGRPVRLQRDCSETNHPDNRDAPKCLPAQHSTQVNTLKPQFREIMSAFPELMIMPYGKFFALSVVLVAGLPLAGQQDPAHPVYATAATDLNSATTNLPIQKVGAEDLIGLQVYDAPEFTRTVRIAADGTIRLPMLKEKLRVDGLYPSDIEVLLGEALKREGLFVDPFVTVNVVEYHSRPISVGGAVRTPVIFQAVGKVTLLDALARAGGLAPDIVSGATGSEVVVTRPNGDSGPPSIQRIPVKPLMSGSDPELNITLIGGEEIRVPEVNKIVVTGNVTQPGVYPVLDPIETNTVKSAVAQAKGLAQYWATIGYIYRMDDKGAVHEIEIPLRKIMNRKAPDVQLQARDVLYVPDSSGRRITQESVQLLMGMGPAVTNALIYTTVR